MASATGREHMPRYRWIREQLVRMIIDQKLKGGAPLQSEVQLARHFGVALGTLRKAIDDLVDKNVLERVQGKGLFVASHDTDAAMRLFSLVGENGVKELPSFDKLLSSRTRAADANERNRLQLDKGTKVVELARTRRFADGTVLAETICLPATRFPDIAEQIGALRPLLLYDFYEQVYGIRVVSVISRIRAVVARKPEADVIGCAPGTPLLEIERVAITLGSVPVELRTTLCETDRRRYVHTIGQDA